MLMQPGPAPSGCPEALSLSDSELLSRIARRYLEVGAEVIQTNTFGASPLKLARWGLADRAAEINTAAVRAVRSVAGGRAYVSGSCGPCGRLLRPLGDADPGEVLEGFRVQLAALASGGVDVICIETMADLAEAQLALRAAVEAAPATPRIATMTFERKPRGFFTVMGVSIARAAEALADAGAHFVGSNCGNGSAEMIEIARQFREYTDLPLVIQPNAGVPVLRDGQTVYPESPELFAAHARAIIDLGVAVIGGCCGTTPAHIRALRAAVDATRPPSE